MCECDACEVAFEKGTDHMRKLILEKLLNMKGKALGSERCTLSEIIKMIERLEV